MLPLMTKPTLAEQPLPIHSALKQQIDMSPLADNALENEIEWDALSTPSVMIDDQLIDMAPLADKALENEIELDALPTPSVMIDDQLFEIAMEAEALPTPPASQDNPIAKTAIEISGCLTLADDAVQAMPPAQKAKGCKSSKKTKGFHDIRKFMHKATYTGKFVDYTPYTPFNSENVECELEEMLNATVVSNAEQGVQKTTIECDSLADTLLCCVPGISDALSTDASSSSTKPGISDALSTDASSSSAKPGISDALPTDASSSSAKPGVSDEFSAAPAIPVHDAYPPPMVKDGELVTTTTNEGTLVAREVSSTHNIAQQILAFVDEDLWQPSKPAAEVHFEKLLVQIQTVITSFTRLHFCENAIALEEFMPILVSAAASRNSQRDLCPED